VDFHQHITEQLFGTPLIANLNSSWPALAIRVSQLQPLQGLGLRKPLLLQELLFSNHFTQTMA